MTVKNAKSQDYLSIGNYAAQIRQDATFHVDFLTTADIVENRFLTTQATRLAGIRACTDTVISSGNVAVTILRVRAGALDTLASFVLDGSIITAADTPTDVPDSTILTNISVKAGDAIRIVTVGTTPTSANFSLVIQFAQNGSR
jgi:hypothetical protein